MDLVILLLALASPFALMIWMTKARRKAQAATRDHEVQKAAPYSREAFTEEEVGEDGLSHGRRYDGDDAVIPPDNTDGEVDGVKAQQGRR